MDDNNLRTAPQKMVVEIIRQSGNVLVAYNNNEAKKEDHENSDLKYHKHQKKVIIVNNYI